MFIWNSKQIIISMVIIINMFRSRNWCDFPSWQPPYMTRTQPKRWQWGLNHKNSRREKFGHSTQVFIHLARLRSFIEYHYWIYLDCHYIYVDSSQMDWLVLVGFFRWATRDRRPCTWASRTIRISRRRFWPPPRRGICCWCQWLTAWFMKIDGSQQGDDHKSNKPHYVLFKRTILVYQNFGCPEFWANLSISICEPHFEQDQARLQVSACPKGHQDTLKRSLKEHPFLVSSFNRQYGT